MVTQQYVMRLRRSSPRSRGSNREGKAFAMALAANAQSYDKTVDIEGRYRSIAGKE